MDATPLGASTWVTEQRIASVQGSDVNTMSIGHGGKRGSRITPRSWIAGECRSWWDGRSSGGRDSRRSPCVPRVPEMGGRSKIGGGGEMARMGKLRRHGDHSTDSGQSRASRLGISPHAHGQLCVDHGKPRCMPFSGGPGGAAVEMVHDLVGTQSGEHWHSLPDAGCPPVADPAPSPASADRP